MRRVIGIDVHRTFGEVVFWENGRLRHMTPLSPRRSSRTCMHPWACTRQMRDRRYDASLRRSSGVIDR
jgi:hypothetical protein